jgi:DNA-binding NarL/FixJ family response regulator
MTVRVLIVDDQAPFRQAARTVVDHTPGFAVIGEVASGEASIEAARTLQPHLIMMDVHLPGMDGLAATRAILGSPSDSPPVVLLLSTYEAEQYAERAAACGAAAYVPKSEISPETLERHWRAARPEPASQA